VKGYVSERDSVINAYLASAEPREKQIEIDARQIRALQKQNGERTDKVKELEAQIEKMKCHSNCKHRSEYNEFDPYSKVCQSCCNLEKWEFGN
jgi:predicted RNase H-like nuclease (RuvC/YqgF family)